MYFFIESCRNLQATAELLNVDLQEIYLSVSQKFYEENSLPAFADWGDGFTQHEATDEETAEVANALGVSVEDLFVTLDEMFVSDYEDAADKAFKSCANVANNEIYKEEVESSNYVLVFALDAPDAEIAVQEYLDEKDDNDKYEYIAQSAYETAPYLFKVRYNVENR